MLKAVHFCWMIIQGNISTISFNSSNIILHGWFWTNSSSSIYLFGNAAFHSRWMISPLQCTKRTSRMSNQPRSCSRTLPSSFYRIRACEVSSFILLDVLSDHFLICCKLCLIPNVPFFSSLLFQASFCKINIGIR
jgi:hypothetical protein